MHGDGKAIHESALGRHAFTAEVRDA